MADYIESLQTLADRFGSLPGVGKKSALRMAYSVLELSDEEAKSFAEAIINAKEKYISAPFVRISPTVKSAVSVRISGATEV